MNDKLKSRKFIVWTTTTILLILSFIIYAIVKTDLITSVCKILAEGYVWISTLYIGGNTIQKFASKNKETEVQ